MYASKTLSGSFPKDYATLKKDISKKDLSLIKAGYSLFSKPWVQAPASTKIRDGLGPHFSATSCISCHHNLGRGNPILKSDQVHPSLVFRLQDHQGQPDSNYGDQLTMEANVGQTPEAQVTVKYQYIKEYYKDKSSYTLTVPSYSFNNFAYGQLDSTTTFSPRVAPHLAGLNEIEKVSLKQVLKKNDPNDFDKDGISGKVNWIIHNKVIGRFGWKASQPTIEKQNAAAFHNDMSITSGLFPKESCAKNQTKCLKSISGGTPEINSRSLSYITLMIKSIAPPKSHIKTKNLGAKLFKQISCHKCHTPSYTVNNNQVISPYTDLLLHDMGEGLADGGKHTLAREWKTPPLWGLGLQQKVNGHTRYLHDGRARSLEEAILWHDGEGSHAKNLFKSLSKRERNLLISFIKSL